MTDAATQGLAADRFCESCGYNLRGLTGDRCPECGSEFDPDALPIAQIPWLRRSRIGVWKAYWQTVFAVILHPIQFARETGKPVQLKLEDADRFRKVVCRAAAVSATIGFIGPLLLRFSPQTLLETSVGLLIVGLGAWTFASIFLRICTTSLPITFVAPADIPRARIMLCYAAAPWAMLPPLAFLGVCTACFGAWDFSRLLFSCFVLGLIVQLVLAWGIGVVMVSSISGYRTGSVVEAGVLIPLTYFGAAVASIAALFAIGAILTILLSMITGVLGGLLH